MYDFIFAPNSQDTVREDHSRGSDDEASTDLTEGDGNMTEVTLDRGKEK